ncbi:MAG: DcaP family trimeric outer membrane transporter, partial [Anaeromyxobacteraceae bacterium]
YLPLDGTPEARRTDRDDLTGRTSRLGLEAGTPTRFGVLGIKLEGDFNNEPRLGNASQNGANGNVFTQQSTSSYGFRVRHLYGQLGGLLAGQTWSTFQDVDNFPETVDYNGPIGQTFIRQPQIRYTYAMPDWGSYTVALENSSAYVLDDTGTVMGASSLSRLPDLVVRWDKSFERGAVSVRAMTQELRVDDGNGHTAATRGWGAAASALYKTREAGDFVTAGITGGDGIGRYLNYIEGAFYDAAANKVLAERALGIYAGYQLKATSWVRVNFAYGATRDFNNDYTAFAAANGLNAGRFGVNRWVQQAHLGPIFTPMKGIDLGLEGIWAKRETLAGEQGEDRRLNFSIKYYIN